MSDRQELSRMGVVGGIVAVLWSGGGTIAQPVLLFEALPELSGGASEVFGLGGTDDCQDNDVIYREILVAGRWWDDDGIFSNAVVWTKPIWEPFSVDVLPNPFGNTDSVAFTIKSRGIGNTTGHVQTLSAGHANDIDGEPQPVAWSFVTESPGVGNWIGEVLPLPPGGTGGSVSGSARCSGACETCRFALGGTILEDGLSRAVLWTRTQTVPTWTVELLPEFGPGLSSEANSAELDTNDPLDPDDDLLIIGGSVQTNVSPQVPCLWQEIPGGGFERVDLLMTPGASRGSVSAFRVVLGKGDPGPAYYSVGNNAAVAGLADLYRGVLYKRTNGVWGAPLELPPLPGIRDSRATDIVTTPEDTSVLIVVGYSYVELSPGSERATLWRVAPDNTVSVYDLNDTIPNLPMGATLNALVGTVTMALPLEFTFMVGNYTSDSPLAGPGSSSHAFILTNPPASIPTLSTLGAAAMGALLLVAAYSIMRRATKRDVSTSPTSV